MFRDKYTNFTFNDLRSENFKVWITNKHDLKYNLSPNFTDKFNTPTLGQTRYYEGTTIDKQDIKVSCAAINITLNEWKAISNWLSPLVIGKLRFDWNTKYYYNVKVSKPIEVEMWSKGKIDPVLGDLFIVTFNVNFTTVGDWAALSDASECIVLRSQNNKYTVDNILTLASALEEEIYYDNTSARYYECIKSFDTVLNADDFKTYWKDVTIDSSVFNNQYLIPSIVPTPIVYLTECPNQSGFWGSEIVECIVDKDQLSSGEKQIRIENVSGTLVKNIKLSVSNGVICDHYDDDNNILWTEKPSITNLEDDKISFSIFSSLNEFWKLQTDGFKMSVYRWTVDKCNYGFLCNNSGTFHMYPTIYSTIPYTIKDNYIKYCSFQYNGVQSTNYSTILNSKNNTLTAYGTPIDAIINAVGMPVFAHIDNNEQIAIETGRPEILKAKLINIEKLTHGWRYSFKLMTNIIYDRYKPYTMVIHNIKKNTTNIFDIDNYGKLQYGDQFTADNFVVYISPVWNILEQTLVIDVPDVSIGGSLDLSEENGDPKEYTYLNKIFYLSLADIRSYGINILDDNQGTISVNCQNRDVI